MTWIGRNLWLIPVLPLVAAGITAFLNRRQRRAAAGLAIGSMVLALGFSFAALVAVMSGGDGFRDVINFAWVETGTAVVGFGWVLDPLSALMLFMVTFVGLWIFIYSTGYMSEDGNYTRFFCFLSLFAAAMLGLVMANSLLLLFVCWELVGLASYLLIGFWHHKPQAAAAAKKAFITTRIGDLGLFLGMLWLYRETGTLWFYDAGAGSMEAASLGRLAGLTTAVGMSVATAIALLIFCGAAGKSGQVPLHVWLPDAMEGPTPVSALIHAATMVAAGVFLVARVFPLMGAAAGVDAAAAGSAALSVVTWVGAITAVFAAMIAVAQYDIKRILAYSTVSQLGFMFLGLGTGGVAVGMFHLITHAFFKALLFLGAGSVIHGCRGEQDIRRMGGLRSRMPVTFLTYAVGMMSLAGVPMIAGFWSKDEILHSAWGWGGSRIPFLMGCFAALLTAFYMTRQMCLVFFGTYRGDPRNARAGETGGKADAPHESPREMTLPLVVLAVGAVIVGFLGTPFWPGFQRFLGEGAHDIHWGSTLLMMGVSSLLAAAGIGAGCWWYGLETRERAEDPDPIEVWRPALFRTLGDAFRVDEFYALTIGRLTSWLAWVSDWLDRRVWGGAVRAVEGVTLAVAWVNRVVDEQVINGGFDAACGGLRGSGRRASRMQTGQVQTYLRILGLGLVVLMLVLAWGCEAS